VLDVQGREAEDSEKAVPKAIKKKLLKRKLGINLDTSGPILFTQGY
jgi:hypothetical protein